MLDVHLSCIFCFIQCPVLCVRFCLIQCPVLLSRLFCLSIFISCVYSFSEDLILLLVNLCNVLGNVGIEQCSRLYSSSIFFASVLSVCALQKMVNGGTVNNWMCINFSRSVQDSVARSFCYELAQMCYISGMVCILVSIISGFTVECNPFLKILYNVV